MATISINFLFHGNILTGSSVKGDDKFHGDLVGLHFFFSETK